ncbi:glycolipid transfer protein [Trifolium repens]|nr:glycolipid transfer protein [Trifolium repens]
MDFLVALFRNLIEHDDWPMSQACTDAYNKTLKKLHGWLASSNFTVVMKLAPDRKKFMEVIGGTGDINADTEKFCTAFSPLLVQNHKLMHGQEIPYECLLNGVMVIVGYLLAGSLIGPGGLKFISEMVQLKAVGPVAVLGGLLQIVIFMFLCGILAMLCGGKLSEGVFVGSFLSMSSTAVDCAVGLLFALLPVLGGNSGLLQGIISMGKLMHESRLQKRSKGRSCSDRIVVRYWRKEQKARTCVAPLERLKLEYIVRGEKKNIFELIKSIATSQGLRGFWKGNLLNILRTAPFKAVTLVLTIHIERRFSGNEETTNFERFIAGAAAGVTSTIISLPLDTVCGNFHDFRDPKGDTDKNCSNILSHRTVTAEREELFTALRLLLGCQLPRFVLGLDWKSYRDAANLVFMIKVIVRYSDPISQIFGQ